MQMLVELCSLLTLIDHLLTQALSKLILNGLEEKQAISLQLRANKQVFITPILKFWHFIKWLY